MQFITIISKNEHTFIKILIGNKILELIISIFILY